MSLRVSISLQIIESPTNGVCLDNNRRHVSTSVSHCQSHAWCFRRCEDSFYRLSKAYDPLSNTAFLSVPSICSVPNLTRERKILENLYDWEFCVKWSNSVPKVPQTVTQNSNVVQIYLAHQGYMFCQFFRVLMVDL